MNFRVRCGVRCECGSSRVLVDEHHDEWFCPRCGLVMYSEGKCCK